MSDDDGELEIELDLDFDEVDTSGDALAAALAEATGAFRVDELEEAINKEVAGSSDGGAQATATGVHSLEAFAEKTMTDIELEIDNALSIEVDIADSLEIDLDDEDHTVAMSISELMPEEPTLEADQQELPSVDIDIDIDLDVDVEMDADSSVDDIISESSDNLATRHAEERTMAINIADLQPETLFTDDGDADVELAADGDLNVDLDVDVDVDVDDVEDVNKPAVLEIAAAKTILLADSDGERADMVAQLLMAEGFEVRRVAGGLEALAAVREHGVDIVIAWDILLGVHGFELCRSIKAADGFQDTRVLICSNHYFSWRVAADARRVFGVDELLCGSFANEELLRSVSQLLSNGSQTPEVAPPAAVEAVDAAISMLDNGEWPAAFDEIEKAMGHGEDSPLVHVAIASALNRDGLELYAMLYCERALRLDPHSQKAAGLLAELVERIGFEQEASDARARADYLGSIAAASRAAAVTVTQAASDDAAEGA